MFSSKRLFLYIKLLMGVEMYNVSFNNDINLIIMDINFSRKNDLFLAYELPNQDHIALMFLTGKLIRYYDYKLGIIIIQLRLSTLMN